MSTLQLYEDQIEKFAGRIRRMEESPDPTLLRSNKLFDELEKEQWEAQRDAVQAGKPLCEGRRIERLLTAMGMQWIQFTLVADRATRFSEYQKVIGSQGFPEKFCDRAVSCLAMCAPGISDAPVPQIIFLPIHACDAHWLVDDALARWHNVPVFNLDVGVNSENKLNLDSLNYIADQLGEFIEWAESKVPGVKYDKDKHIEIIETDAIGLKYLREIYRLSKQIPCPMVPEDSVRRPLFPRYAEYPNMQKAVEALRICRDELGDRVASGSGPCPEERLRLVWATGAQHYDFKPWQQFMERKVAVPVLFQASTARISGVKYAPYGEVSEYGVKLSPLQEEARWLDTISWGGPGTRWTTDLLDVARDIGAQGIVHGLLIGCTPILGVGTMLAERAEKELGIPVLNVEMRQLDKDYMSEEQFEEILSAFIDKCFDRAGKPRQ